MKHLRHLILATALGVAGLSAQAAGAPKLLATETGTVSGTLNYASMQYWIQSGKEAICIMYDDKDDDRLMALNGKKVTFTGPIQTWSNQKLKHCIAVGPNYPKEVR